MFAVATLWIGLVGLLETEHWLPLLSLAPFVLGSAAALWMMVAGRSCPDLTRATVGVRTALATIAAAGILLVLGIAWPGGLGDTMSWLYGTSMRGFTLTFFFLPLLLPLVAVEQRLRARAHLGNSLWHPHLATTEQRRQAVHMFGAAVGGVSCGAIGLLNGFKAVSFVELADLREPLSQGILGLFGGMGIGVVAAAPMGVRLDDRNLARALPPIALAAPLAGVGGSLFGVGWGIAAVFVSMLGVTLVMERRHKLFEPYRCQSCGYDLTGLLPEGGPCPECAHPAPPLVQPDTVPSKN